MPKNPRPATPGYARLARAFPLRPLRGDADLAAAQAVLDDLLRRNRLDGGEKDYLDVLADLVEKYERAAHPIPDAPEAEVLRFLMASNGLSQVGLAAAVGVAQSTISAVLAGKRRLTRDQVVRVAAHFGVSPAAFLARGVKP